MPKSHDLGHIRGHVIRILKLPKIAKIDSIRLAVLHYFLGKGIISIAVNEAKFGLCPPPSINIENFSIAREFGEVAI